MAPSDPTLAPPPQLLQRLARRRLSVPAAYTAGGVGEHPSVAKGPGLEFAEHRAYQPGDDLRRVDPHVEARSGELYVREFEVLERLAVTVVVDLSASMAFGEPEKAAFARRLAGALAYVGLAGADRVRVAAFTGRGLAWGPRTENARAAGRLFDWLARQAPGGAVDLASVARELGARLPRPGLLLLVSDWLFAAPQPALTLLRAAQQEVVGVQVLAPSELDPSGLGAGAVTLQDAETGAEREVRLDAATLARYAERLAAWRAELETSFVRHGGTWLTARSDTDLERLLLVDWAGSGLIR